VAKAAANPDAGMRLRVIRRAVQSPIKEEQQVILYSMIAMFLFSALGGTWFPLESSSGAFAAVGKLMPSAWAMNGFQNILIRGLGLESVWMAVGALSAYAIGFFLLAVWRFRKMDV
jgi:ABC-2 type transport system permease protein